MNDPVSLTHFEVTLSGPGTLPTVARAAQHMRVYPAHEVWIALSNHGMGDDHPVLWTCRTCSPGMDPHWRNEDDHVLIEEKSTRTIRDLMDEAVELEYLPATVADEVVALVESRQQEWEQERTNPARYNVLKASRGENPWE